MWHRGFRSIALAVVLASPVAVPTTSIAQGLVSVGLGGGIATSSDPAGTRMANGVAFLQVKPPLLPGGRAEALAFSNAGDMGPLALGLAVVVSAPVPVVTPYLIGGVAHYGVGKTGSVSGWNFGGGVRAGIPMLGGLFVELRRHDKLGRNLLTFGLMF